MVVILLHRHVSCAADLLRSLPLDAGSPSSALAWWSGQTPVEPTLSEKMTDAWMNFFPLLLLLLIQEWIEFSPLYLPLVYFIG